MKETFFPAETEDFSDFEERKALVCAPDCELKKCCKKYKKKGRYCKKCPRR